MAKGAGCKRGRSKPKYERYRNAGRRAENKIRRILKSNGVDAAQEYALRHGKTAYFRRILSSKATKHGLR